MTAPWKQTPGLPVDDAGSGRRRRTPCWTGRRARAARMALGFVAVTALMAAAGIDNKAVAEAHLRLNTVARGEMVLLSDLFENPGPAALAAAFSAPLPGQSAYVDLARVAAAADANGIQWQRPPGVTRVMVTREGTPIPAAAISAAIREEFRRRDPQINLELAINPRKTALFVPYGGDTTVIVEGLDHETRNGNFHARLFLPGAVPGSQRIRVPGRARIIKEIPVLSRRVPIGEEIAEEDLKWIEISTDRMGRGVVEDAGDLLGQSPKRSIKPGVPIRFRDIQKPLLVRKGSLVKLVVQTPFMHISTTGKALDSGAAGDTIRILNTSSKQVVQAVVDARNRALVLTHDRVAAIR